MPNENYHSNVVMVHEFINSKLQKTIKSGVTCLPYSYPFKRQSNKMVKHTERIRRLLPTNCLGVFDHFVGLVLKGLKIATNFQWMGFKLSNFQFT